MSMTVSRAPFAAYLRGEISAAEYASEVRRDIKRLLREDGHRKTKHRPALMGHSED